MADELYKRLLDKLSGLCVGDQHVHDREVGEHQTVLQNLEGLLENIISSKARNSLVPDAAEELLDIGMGHE